MRLAGIEFALLLSGLCLAESDRLDLNGAWQFRLDPENRGEREEWHSTSVPFPDSIVVPGCWQAQGFGQRAGILRRHYAGTAWYRRTVAVPAGWKDKVVRLRIGGALRYTTLFFNGKLLGQKASLSAPFDFEVTAAVRPGRENIVALRVANSRRPNQTSPEARDPSEPTGTLNYIGNWGGIHGNVELEATDPVWIENVFVIPDIEHKLARFKVLIHSREPAQPFTGRLEVSVSGGQYHGSAAIPIRTGEPAQEEVSVPIPDAQLWSPERPDLYHASMVLRDGQRERHRREERFGMRQIAVRGNTLLLNGKPLYVRGYGDDSVEVLTGAPPPGKQVYLERLRLAKSYGFNAVRFHSMTPRPEFFDAADEVGLLVMAELPVAYTNYFLPHKEFLREELRSILLAHRNHPSLLSLALGNEFNLGWLKTGDQRREFLETVAEFYRLAKSLDPTRPILSNDGYLMRPTDLASLARGVAADLPTIRHEFGGYYCSLPDVSLIDRFTGVIVPAWLEARKTWIETSGLAEVYPAYVRNSQRLLHLGRKYQIERVRRQPNVTGYHYWLIVDFPGGTAEGDSWEEGWFDYFWQPKGVTPEEGREINSAVLPLLDIGVEERSWWAGGSRTIGVLVSNFGDSEIRDAVLGWQLTAGGQEIARSQKPGVAVPLGSVAQVAEVLMAVPADTQARKLELEVELVWGDRRHVNRWHFWSFPKEALLKRPAAPVSAALNWTALYRLYPFVRQARRKPEPGGVLITPALNDESFLYLKAGGRVWLLTERGRDSDGTFFPAAGGAQGTRIAGHPALNGFPHEGFCDLQFYNLLEGAASVPLDRLPRELVPIVGAVKTTAAWLSKTKNLAKVGYVFELKVGRGKLLVTTLKIRENLDEAYPEVVYLFDGLLRYTLSADFNPSIAIDEDEFLRIFDRYFR